MEPRIETEISGYYLADEIRELTRDSVATLASLQGNDPYPII